jgi:biopolymer transport protein ExbB
MKRHPRISVPALILAWPMAATAQTTTSEALQKAAEELGGSNAPAVGGVTLLEILEKGGPMMYPLGALSFVGVILIVVYMLTLRQGTVVTMRFMDVAESLMRKQDYLGLAAVCNRSGQSIARIMQRAMDFIGRNPGATVEEVREVAQAEGVRQASMMTQRISYLADIGSIAPMVGLLGTVLGMMKSFNTLSGGSFVGAKTMELASGVSEALITTAAGLFVGIPALAFYAVFRGKVQKLISELESASTHLLAMFAANHDSTGRQSPARQPVRSRPAARDEDYADDDFDRTDRRR